MAINKGDVFKLLSKDFWNHSAMRNVAAQDEESFVQNKQFLRDRGNNLAI